MVFSEMAAILDAIFDFSECHMVSKKSPEDLKTSYSTSHFGIGLILLE